ncbi:Crp/Fnr family transcriptional regulator [Candidatus Poribacteria bacterium]|nr:Crp/Fnr family transcriptional regulator [Candidatus Poribacteria bacterium]
MLNKIFLKKVNLLSELEEHDLEKLLLITSERNYKQDEIIFHENDTGSFLFILKSGSVKISICDRNGNEDILKIIYPNDFFGEMSLLDGQHRSATVTAIEDCSTLIIQRENFIELISKYPEMALNILAVLCRRIRKTDEKIGLLRFADAYGKIAKVLLDISKEQGNKDKNGNVIINLNISRQEFADFAGLSRETAARILNEFHKSGCIKVDGKKITILNEGMLRREAI